MICLRKRALISVWLALLFVSCRSQGDSARTEPPSSETVVSSTPPFKTREPDRYRATRVLTTVMVDGESWVMKISVARDGEMRRNETDVASKKVAYLELPTGRFALLPGEKVYADLGSDPEEELSEDDEVSPEGLLHADGGNTSYQKLGAETIGGRNTNKYRVVVNSSNAANVSVSETLIWIDESLQMPVRSETKSANGSRVTMELSDIEIEVSKEIFQIPKDYKKIAYSELQKRLKAD